MTNLIFFGAGASKPFGIPTMQEMVDEFEKKMESEDKECFQFYSNIKKILVEEYGKSRVDIESIFSVLDGIVSQTKAKDLGHYAYYHIKSICKSYPEGRPTNEYVEQANRTENILKKYLRESCEIKLSELERNEIYDKSYLSFFSNIKGEIHDYPNNKLSRDWKAYTTNYDNVFEGFWNAFEPAITHFAKEPNSNNYVFSSKKLSRHSFCKLHGSLDWTRETSTGRIIQKNTSGYNIYNTKGTVMLFPIQQKDLYLHPWFTLFSDLREGLQTQSIWYVVGYAFNDEFIRNVFQEILVTEPSKKLVLINPDAEDIAQKFLEPVRNHIDVLPIKFGGDFFNLQFTDYLKSIKTIVIRIVTPNRMIHVNSNKKIVNWAIINEDKIGTSYSINIGSDPQFTISLDKPTEHEIKIELQFQYEFGEKIELSLSDHTEELDFGIDYAGLLIANSTQITGYGKKHSVMWMENSIVLDKYKLYRK